MTTSAGATFARGGEPTTVPVVLTADGIEVQNRVDGRVLTFDVSTTAEFGSLQVFAPKCGTSVAEVLEALEVGFQAEEPAALAAFTRYVTGNAEWYGGVDVAPGVDQSFTVRLDRGTYYLIDFAAGFSVEKLRVTGSGSGGLSDADSRIEMQEGTHEGDIDFDKHAEHGEDGEDGEGAEPAHEFEAPESMPASGVLEVRNENEVIHVLFPLPVQTGTTDEEIQEFIDGGFTGEDPTLEGPTAGLNILSPDERALLPYDLPPGTYVALCFIADEINGVEHFVLGMHKMIELT